MRYVIVGNSAAGVAAATAIRSVDPGGDITIVSEEGDHAYSRIFLPDLIKGRVTKEGLVWRGREWYRSMRIRLLSNCRACDLNTSAREIGLDTGHSLGYDRLLLATGARPQALGLDGERLRGVFGLRTMGDALGIASAACPGVRAVVLGGGLVGLKAAEALLAVGVQVTVVVGSGHVLSRQVDEKGAAIIQDAMNRVGVRVMTRSKPLRIIDDGDGRVGFVELQGGTRLPASIVVTAKGVEPNVGLARFSGIEIESGILVDQRMETNVPGVYAAGDVAQVGSTVLSIWPVAVRQGRVAGVNMAGGRARYEPLPPMNIVRVFGIGMASVGDQLVESGEDEVSTYMAGDIYRRLMVRQGVVVGALEVGSPTGAGVASWLVRSKRRVTPPAEEHVKEGFHKMGLFRVWKRWRSS